MVNRVLCKSEPKEARVRNKTLGELFNRLSGRQSTHYIIIKSLFELETILRLLSFRPPRNSWEEFLELYNFVELSWTSANRNFTS